MECPYRTEAEILKRAQEAKGIPLGKIDKTGRLETGKGAVGTVIEESWFGYTPNSISEPDFAEAGVELKTVPYVFRGGHVTAKERLVCNIIDFMAEWRASKFEESSFWHKCAKLLLMTYEHKDKEDKRDFKIDEAVLFSYPEADRAIIRKDWRIIVEKILLGKAHLLTEGDTMFLTACTKGETAAGSVRDQPFSPEEAKQRAYALKATYVTNVLRSYIYGSQTDEHIVKDWRLLEQDGIEGYITRKIQPHYGKTQIELAHDLGVDIAAKPKNLNALLVSRILSRMLDVNGKVDATYEFQMAHVIPKTIRVQRDGRVRESMSFPAFKFTEVINETWETSSLRNYLEPAKFLFVVFRESADGAYVLERVFFWNIPFSDLQEVKRVWERTVQVIKDGVEITRINGRNYNNFPKQAESPVAHVRPHAQTQADTYPLPDGRKMPKQCFWLNNTYVAKVIAQNIAADSADTNGHHPVSPISVVGSRAVLPLYSLHAACGRLGPEQHPLPERNYVCVSGLRKLSRDRHFIVTAIGDSMNPKIHDGDLCVFEWGDGEAGKTVLVERAETFQETSGSYVIKNFDGTNQLKSLNRAYAPIEADENCRIKAMLIGVLALEGETADGTSIYHVDKR